MQIKLKSCPCGTEFRPYKSTDKFCSLPCAKEAQKEKAPRKQTAKVQRRVAADRRYFRVRGKIITEQMAERGHPYCQNCDKPLKSPHAHHIVYRSEAPEHKNLHHRDNLVIVGGELDFDCECHAWFHSEKGNRFDIVLKRQLWQLFPTILHRYTQN